MPRRLVPVGAALALLAAFAALAGVIISACYDVPQPACGFVCGPGGACPDGYRCASDHYCHREGTPDSLVCRTPDAALPADAAPDGPPDGMIDSGADAPAGNDAPSDAPSDAAPDAAPDAIDAAPDAAPDAVDAAPDAATDAAAADAPP